MPSNVVVRKEIDTRLRSLYTHKGRAGECKAKVDYIVVNIFGIRYKEGCRGVQVRGDVVVVENGG